MTQMAEVRPFERRTAQALVSRGQLVFAGAVVGALAMAAVLDVDLMLRLVVAGAIAFYILFVGLKAVLIAASRNYRPPAAALPRVDADDLPTYTVFVPLYNEAAMLPALVDALDGLNYPKDRLQVLLLLEEDDDVTQTAARNLYMPDYFEVVSIPAVGPRTKPKACNIGLQRARGEYCVIYDAEDRPDPDQLLTAVGTFRRSDEDVVCLQARLAFWNGTFNFVTRMYWAEYVVHFEWMLRGMARLGIVPPLGGTSNHFVTDKLRELAIPPYRLPEGSGVGGWDPYNVTEDAELAGAIAQRGYRVEMIDSVTWEAASSKLGVADKQRRRWLKGYVQTGLVYTQRPFTRLSQMGVKNFVSYNTFMLGTPLSLLLNPIFWSMTVLYFTTRSAYIEELFPPLIFYPGLLLMIAGNFFLFYMQMVACLKRQGYETVKYMFAVPAWWAFTSWSAAMMLIELIRPSTRSMWRKTEHDHDLAYEGEVLPLKRAS